MAKAASTGRTVEGDMPPPSEDIRRGAAIAPRLKNSPRKLSAVARPDSARPATNALAAVFSTPPPMP